MIEMNEFSFGRRRITKVNYTYLISLPKVWLENKKLEVGDELELVMVDNSLVLKTVEKEVAERKGLRAEEIKNTLGGGDKR